MEYGKLLQITTVCDKKKEFVRVCGSMSVRGCASCEVISARLNCVCNGAVVAEGN